MTTYHDPKKRNSEMVFLAEQSGHDAPENHDRRKILKKLAIGTAAVAGCSVLPSKWLSPVVEFGVLPAHAVTSGTSAAPASAVQSSAAPAPAAPAPAATGASTEKGLYWGRHNGNRPTWYFSRAMRDYPQQFTVVIDGCATVQVTNNNGTRFESGATIIKQSDVSGRGMAVVGSAGCYSRTSHITF